MLSIAMLYLVSLIFLPNLTPAQAGAPQEQRFLQVDAKTKEDRSAIANLGISIEAVRSDSIWGFANQGEIEKLNKNGFKILGNFNAKVARGGHETMFDFPSQDSQFHNYDRLIQALKDLETKNPDLISVSSIGKSLEGRNLWAVHFNSSKADLTSGVSNRPGVVYMGDHHAREHVSVEVPLLFAQYLVAHRNDLEISNLLRTRDIWIIPMVNPDGAEYDVASGSYQMWRKNRRDNKDGTFGVDLNRNYSYQWGTGGSVKDTSSEIYMGPTPFSEPETQAVRDFVRAHNNLKILLSFHTFSELILYPWGHTYDGIGNEKDYNAFQKMATTMAEWNHYTAEQASSLYIASGDTTDWAYGELGIFAFTFELSPSSDTFGTDGFYPGETLIQKVFNDNLQPCLYLLRLADNPYQVLDTPTTTGWLTHYIQPGTVF